MRLQWIAPVLMLFWSELSAAQTIKSDEPYTKEQWNDRISERRIAIQRRNAQLRAQAKNWSPPSPPNEEQLFGERIRQAFDDPNLMPGDLVATGKGLFQFRGSRDRETTPGDFVPLPEFYLRRTP